MRPVEENQQARRILAFILGSEEDTPLVELAQEAARRLGQVDRWQAEPHVPQCIRCGETIHMRAFVPFCSGNCLKVSMGEQPSPQPST